METHSFNPAIFDAMTDFNQQAAAYRSFRPTYPDAFARQLSRLVQYRGVCWDAGTGTGQMALLMARHFNLVCASDIGSASIRLAPGHKGVLYSVQPAEKTDYPDHFFDLAVAAQAAHWFDLPAYYQEVRRVVRPGGVLAIVGYGRPQLPDWLQPAYDHLELDVLGTFWAPQVQLLDDGYQTIDFPFEEITLDMPEIRTRWRRETLEGFVHSWSAWQNFTSQLGTDEANDMLQNLLAAWPKGVSEASVVFPMVGRIGRLPGH